MGSLFFLDLIYCPLLTWLCVFYSTYFVCPQFKFLIASRHATTEENGVITGFQIIASASFEPKEKFQLMAIVDAILTQWRHDFKTCNNY